MLNTIRRLILVNGCMLSLLFAMQSVASDDRQAFKILIMGDSLSAGYGIDVQQGWVQLLSDRLASLTGDNTYLVINASVSGETTTGGVSRLPKLLSTHAPQLVILELGGNDGLRGQPINIMRKNLANMIEMAHAADAKVLLLGIQIPPNYGARYSDAFSAVYGELANAYDVNWVPFFLEGVALSPELMQSDGIHPNADAQEKLLDNVWGQLHPLLQ